MIAPVRASSYTDTSGINASAAVFADPNEPGTVWLGTGAAGIFRSRDCGSTWERVNTGRNAAAMNEGAHIGFAFDPVDRGTIYTVSIYGPWGVWKSTNNGVDWDQMVSPDSELFRVTGGLVDAVVMDPTDHLHLVLGMHNDCKAPFATACTAETFDGGKTWKIVNLPTAHWEEQAGPSVISAQHWTYGGSELWLTTDGGAHWSKVTPQGTWAFSNGEVSTHPIVQTKDGTYVLTSGFGIVTSKDGITWKLQPNFSQQLVSITLRGGRLFAANQWNKNGIFTALETDLSKWVNVPPVPDLPDNLGAPFIDYDPVNHVLYTSHFAGGLWRLVLADYP